MSKMLERLDELLKFIEETPAKELCRIVDSIEIDEETVKSYANLENSIINEETKMKYDWKEWAKKEADILEEIEKASAKGLDITNLSDKIEKLHEEEAALIRKVYLASLSMPIDAGRKAIERADRIIKKYSK